MEFIKTEFQVSLEVRLLNVFSNSTTGEDECHLDHLPI